MSYLSNFTAETGRSILMEIIKTVNQSENSKTISLAKASAGKEMLAMMQLVFPLVMKIQMEVITTFGFPGTREGLVQFEQLVREMEREDAEISRLRSQIRAIYLPPIAINPLSREKRLVDKLAKYHLRSKLHQYPQTSIRRSDLKCNMEPIEQLQLSQISNGKLIYAEGTQFLQLLEHI